MNALCQVLEECSLKTNRDLKKLDTMLTGLNWLSIVIVVGCCGHANEPLGAMESGYCPNQLNNCQLTLGNGHGRL